MAGPPAGPEPARPDIEPARSNIEHALVEASRLLVSSTEVDLHEVLRILGEAVEAETAYLVTAPGEEEFSHESPTRSLVTWRRNGTYEPPRLFDVHHAEAPPPALRFLAEAPDDARRRPAQPIQADDGGLAIPLLSKQDRFIGYLGIEHAALPEGTLREHGRVLSVFGDLLASYFSRKHAEQALRESEHRWRRFVDFHPDPILITTDGAIVYANAASAALLGLADPDEVRAHALRDFLPADLYEAVEQQRQAQAFSASPAPIEHEVVRLDGEERTVESVSIATTFRGWEAIQTVLRDVTERKRSEERYRTFVQTISEGVWRLDLEAPVSVMALPSLQAAHILRHGYLAECNAMMTRLLGADRVEDVMGQRIAALLPPLDERALEVFVRGGYRLHNHELTLTLDGDTRRHFAINAVGRVERGVLLRVWGSCVEVTERVEMERRMVAVLEEEQERIGRDLHDSVGQLLTGIRMLSENLGRHLDPDGTAAHDGAAAARKVTAFAEEALQRVRDICRGLVPPQLAQEGLGAALQSLAANLDAVSDVRCTFVGSASLDLPDHDTKLQLYRIAQEAASNALKHAAPTHVWIRLAEHHGALTLEVEDDGLGFDPDEHARTSIGLYSMRRRASSVRAALSIESSAELGTHVRVQLDRPPTDEDAPDG